MQLRAFGLAVCAAACGGHDATSPDAAIDAKVDAMPDARQFAATVAGTLTSLNAVNGSDGAPIVDAAPPDPTQIQLTVTRADGTSDLVPLANDGTFTIGLNAVGQSYRLTLAIAGQPPKDFQSSAPTLAISLVGAGHVRAPVTGEVVIKAVFNNWVDDDTAVLDTTGLWTSTEAGFVTDPPPAATEPWAFQWTWSTADSLSGSLGLLDASQHDELVIGELHPDDALTYESMTAALVHTDITMMNGSNLGFGSDDFPIAIPALPQRCLHVVAPRGTETARIVAAVPDTYTEVIDEWDLFAPAGDGIGPTGAQVVARGTERGSAATDADLTADFGTPFPGSQLLVSTSAHPVREIHATADDDGLFLEAGTQTWAQVATPADCPATPAIATATPTVGIPTFPTLAGVALDHDGVVVPIPATGDVPVTWALAGSGVADEYIANLEEVSATNQITALTLVRGIFGADTTTAFSQGDLVPGNVYMIEIFARQGFPGAGSGDFKTITFPFANSVTLSHTFTVTQ